MGRYEGLLRKSYSRTWERSPFGPHDRFYVKKVGELYKFSQILARTPKTICYNWLLNIRHVTSPLFTDNLSKSRSLWHHGVSQLWRQELDNVIDNIWKRPSKFKSLMNHSSTRDGWWHGRYHHLSLRFLPQKRHFPDY